MAISETTLQIGKFHFVLVMNPANVAARMQRDVFIRQVDGERRFLRSFFFDEITAETLHQFCQHYASDSAYRAACHQRTAGWAQRNDLFLRNCFNPYYQRNIFLEQIGSLVRAFYYFTQHTRQIVNDPRYQAIAQHDRQIEPHPRQPDPNVADIVQQMNRHSGIKTLASCQGVSQIFRYQEYQILAVSPHAWFAYIWFESVPQSVIAQWQTLPSSHITYTDAIYPALVSTGDNAAFREALRHWLQQSTV